MTMIGREVGRLAAATLAVVEGAADAGTAMVGSAAVTAAELDMAPNRTVSFPAAIFSAAEKEVTAGAWLRPLLLLLLVGRAPAAPAAVVVVICI